MKTWATMFFDSRLEKTCPEKTQKDRASPAFSGLQCAEFCHLSVETLELLSLVLDVLLLHSVASNASLLILPCSKHFISWLSWPLVLALRPSSPSTHGLWHGEDRKEKKSCKLLREIKCKSQNRIHGISIRHNLELTTNRTTCYMIKTWYGGPRFCFGSQDLS